MPPIAARLPPLLLGFCFLPCASRRKPAPADDNFAACDFFTSRLIPKLVCSPPFAGLLVQRPRNLWAAHPCPEVFRRAKLIGLGSFCHGRTQAIGPVLPRSVSCRRLSVSLGVFFFFRRDTSCLQGAPLPVTVPRLPTGFGCTASHRSELFQGKYRGQARK